MYFGHGTKIKTYDFATNTVGSDITPAGLADIVGLDFTDANTAFVTTATREHGVGPHDGDVGLHDPPLRHHRRRPGPRTSTWTFPLTSIGAPGGSVDDDGMIDARDLAIVGDKFYVSDGYDSRSGGDHPIYVYTLGQARPRRRAATSSTATAVSTRSRRQRRDHTGRGERRPVLELRHRPRPRGAPQRPGRLRRSTATADSTRSASAATRHPRRPVGGPYWNYDIARGVAFTRTARVATSSTATAGSTRSGRHSGTAPAPAGRRPVLGLRHRARRHHHRQRRLRRRRPGRPPHRFKIGNSGTLRPTPVGGPYWSYDIAQGVRSVRRHAAATSVDGQGGAHGFERRQRRHDPAGDHCWPYWNCYDIARGIAACQQIPYCAQQHGPGFAPGRSSRGPTAA